MNSNSVSITLVMKLSDHVAILNTYYCSYHTRAAFNDIGKVTIEANEMYHAIPHTVRMKCGYIIYNI